MSPYEYIRVKINHKIRWDKNFVQSTHRTTRGILVILLRLKRSENFIKFIVKTRLVNKRIATNRSPNGSRTSENGIFEVEGQTEKSASGQGSAKF